VCNKIRLNKGVKGEKGGNLHPSQTEGTPAPTKGITHPNPPEGMGLGMFLQGGVIGLIWLIRPIWPISK